MGSAEKAIVGTTCFTIGIFTYMVLLNTSFFTNERQEASNILPMRVRMLFISTVELSGK